MSKTKKAQTGEKQIANNRRAFHDYTIEERYEAGLMLEGWEVKSLRAGHIQLTQSYVTLHRGDAWLMGATITPLNTASTHITPESTRSRKLLLHKKELAKLFAGVERKGYTIVPLSMYWKEGRAKLEIGVAKGKKQYDKRADEKNRDWERSKARLLRPK
ncbi:SsrA-binding protein SmpB [soil metagenome]